jgi:hypothetical protein
MAGQTDSADDLIAELARLMAEDAQGDKPKAQPATVRIPGGDAPSVPSTPKPAEAAEPRIRIPGDETDKPAPRVQPDFAPRSMAPEVQPSAPQAHVPPVERQPTNFSEPVRQSAQPAVITPTPAPPTPSELKDPSLPDLDQDSLASIIAAELEVPEMEPEAAKTLEPEIDPSGRSSDTFGVAPVFGFGSPAGSTPTPRVEPVRDQVPLDEPRIRLEPEVEKPAAVSEPIVDPLDEIERLIGPAAHIQTITPPPSPALRSLATPTIPRETPPAPPRSVPNVSSVEEAILAAAATSGAKLEWVEPAIASHLPNEEPVRAARAPRARLFGLSRAMAGPLVATLLLGCAAVALYTVLGLGSNSSDGPAPLVVAESAPIKEVPEQAPPTQENQSVVFNEIEGVNTGAVEQIVSRDQSNLDSVPPAASSDTNEEGLVNRKVRTVTVRPDGTIVSGGDSLAGSTMLPVDRPTVPEVPGADFSTPDLIASGNAAGATASQPATTPAATVVPVQPGSTVPAVDLSGNPVSGKSAPVPLARPADLASRVAISAPTATAPAAPAAPLSAPTAQAPAATQVTSSGSAAPAYVQLSSQRTEEAARQTAQQIVARFGSLFNGANLEIQRVDLAERGIFYRVRVPASSIQAANTLCSSIKANGGDCYTL